MKEPWLGNRGESWVELNPAPENSVLISITEDKKRPARIPEGYLDVLRLGFQDYDPVGKPPASSTGMYTTTEPEAKQHIPENAKLFTQSHAAQISRFVRKHRGKNIVIHCAAGISRSGAVADVLAQAFPEYEDRGWPRFPNGHVMALLKRAMGLVPIGA